LKRFLKIFFLGYCKILVGMVLYSCSKGQGTKTKVQKFKKKEDDKSPVRGQNARTNEKLKIFPKVGVPYH
jgi:hypothetical protein